MEEVFCEKYLFVDSIDEILHVRIFKPFKATDGRGYKCKILITSKQGTMDAETFARGYDSVQSVVGAFMYLGARMHYSNEHLYNGELTEIKGEKEPFPETFGFIKNLP